MAVIKLFGNLRRIAGARELDVAAETVRELMDTICAGQPELCKALLDERGQLKQYVRVMVNGHDVELARGLDTPIQVDDQVAIFPPIAGG